MAVFSALYRNNQGCHVDTRMSDSNGNGQGMWSQDPANRVSLADSTFVSGYVTDDTINLTIKDPSDLTKLKQVIFAGNFDFENGALTLEQFKSINFSGSIKTVYEGDLGYPFAMREVLSGVSLNSADLRTATWEKIFAGNDKLTGGSAGDYLYAYSGNDVLDGKAGNDVLNGGGGNDRYILQLDNGSDTILDSSGSADVLELRITNTVGFNLFRDGTELKIRDANGSDVSTVSHFWGDTSGTAAGEGYIENVDLKNVDTGELSKFKLSLGINTSGADWMIGTVNNDMLDGGAGNDRLQGDAGNDRLLGGAGNDRLLGGAGNDSLLGGDGDDRYVLLLGRGSDVITDSSGTADVLDLRVTNTVGFGLYRDGTELKIRDASSGDISTVTNFWSGASGNIAGKGYIENVELKNVDTDQVFKFKLSLGGNTSGSDWMIGTLLSDTLDGGLGNDRLQGDAGSDVIYGNLGNDGLIGGGGADSFVFNTALNATTNLDNIRDFSSGVDKIILDDDIFTRFAATGSGSGILEGQFIQGQRALDADDHLIYNSTNHMLYYDADGSGTGSAIAFAKVELLGNAVDLKYTDFQVVA